MLESSVSFVEVDSGDMFNVRIVRCGMSLANVVFSSRYNLKNNSVSNLSYHVGLRFLSNLWAYLFLHVGCAHLFLSDTLHQAFSKVKLSPPLLASLFKQYWTCALTLSPVLFPRVHFIFSNSS